VSGVRKRYIPLPGYREYLTIGLLIVEIVLFSVLSDVFFTGENLSRILQNSAELAIVSIGMTMVIIMGGIDLSVGSALGICAIVVGNLLLSGANPVLIVLAPMLIGAFIGLLNGGLIARLRIPDIIVTLATMSIWRAAVFALLGGAWITGLPPVFSGILAKKTAGIPNVFILVLIMYVVFWYVMTFRPFGRHIYAIGTNEEAARLAGISVLRTRVMAYATIGVIVGVASILYTSRMGSVEMTVGADLALQSIAAVVIGGTAITGGRGSLVGTLAGVLFISVMRNGIVILGVPSLLEKAIIGTLILVSVMADIVLQRRLKQKRATPSGQTA
jgi:ribose transport system permease protein/AI-2 transport system permease protein